MQSTSSQVKPLRGNVITFVPEDLEPNIRAMRDQALANMRVVHSARKGPSDIEASIPANYELICCHYKANPAPAHHEIQDAVSKLEHLTTQPKPGPLFEKTKQTFDARPEPQKFHWRALSKGPLQPHRVVPELRAQRAAKAKQAKQHPPPLPGPPPSREPPPTPCPTKKEPTLPIGPIIRDVAYQCIIIFGKERKVLMYGDRAHDYQTAVRFFLDQSCEAIGYAYERGWLPLEKAEYGEF